MVGGFDAASFAALERAWEQLSETRDVEAVLPEVSAAVASAVGGSCEFRLGDRVPDQDADEAELAVPMRAGSGIVGTMVVRRDPGAPPLSAADRWALQAMADHAADVIAARRLGLAEAEATAVASQAMLELEGVVARFETLLRGAPIGLAFLDRDLHFLQVNDHLADMDGIAVGDHIGRPLREVLPDMWEVAGAGVLGVVEHGEPYLDVEVSGSTAAMPGVERSWLLSFYPVAGGGGSVGGVGCVMLEITDRARQQRRVAMSAQLGELFQHAQRADDAVRAAAHIVVPELADVCSVVLFADGSDRFDSAVVVADDDGLPTPTHDLLPALVRSELDVLFAGSQGAAIVGGRPPPSIAALGSAVEATSLLLAPIRTDNGLLGAIALAHTPQSGRRHQPADVELAELVGRRLAELVERIRLLESAARAQARLELLASASELLSAELHVVDRADALLGMAVPRFADHAALFLDDGVGRLRVAAVRHVDPITTEQIQKVTWDPVSVDDDLPASVAARTGAASHASWHPPRLAVPDPGDEHLAEALLAGSVVAVPLKSHHGLLGVLQFAHSSSGRRYRQRDRRLAEELGRIAAPALDHAQRFEHERVTAEVLQRSLMPHATPACTGVEIATRYRPADAELHVGGDWFDVFGVRGDRVLLAIGDVAGHGIEAAVSMGRFRTVLQFAATQSRDPAIVLRRVDAFMRAAFPEDFATLLLVAFDPATGRARVASAGHVPPVVVKDGGRAEAVPLRSGPPLGAVADPQYRSSGLDLIAGSSLLLCTDGLIERRTEAITAGLDRLVAAAAAVGPDDAAALADGVLWRLRPDVGHPDDVAVLAARITVAGPTLDLRLPAAPSVLRRLRSDLRFWMAGSQWSQERVDDIVLSVNEAVANACEHAYTGVEPGDIVVRGRRRPRRCDVEVSDSGRWRQHRPDPRRGRGLMLMDKLATESSVAGGRSGTTARLRFDR